MKEMQIFSNPEFGKIRTIEDGDKTLFCGNDVAKALGYDQPHKAIDRHCKRGTVRNVPHPQNHEKTIEMKFVPEGDLYRLIANSKLSAAEKFERWVFDEVLPTIRKTGGYVNEDETFISTYLPFADDTTKLLFKSTLVVIRNQNQILEEQKPLVHFANKVSDTSDLIDIGKMAKLLHDENISIGRNKLFEWLRKNNILMSNNTPYQKYVDSGHFKVREGTKETPYGTKIFVTTYVTGKGQIYITEKLRNEFGETA